MIRDPRLAAHRPTFAVVDLERLVSNLDHLRQRLGPNVGLLPVVKADAYGHGAVAVAARLAREGVTGFAVALAEEGLELRRAGIRESILLLGVLAPGQVALALEHDLTPTVFEPTLLERLDQAARERGRPLRVHVKVDTGMARIGFPPDEHAGLARRLAQARGLEIAGVFTHFARADEPEAPETARQIERLDAFLARLSAEGLDPGIVHASGSAGILAHPAGWKAVARPGLALYGITPGKTGPWPDLRPVLSLETEVVQVKELAAGSPVGYGATWRAERPSRIATVAIGYADGLPRVLGNRGRALLDGGIARFAGRLSMDMTTLDVTGIQGVEVGAPVTLIGERGGSALPASEIAALAGTIAYEILCAIGPRVPRVYVEQGRVAAVRERGTSGGST